MGFANDKETYRQIQKVMREVAESAGVAPIVIDLIAWDHAHGCV